MITQRLMALLLSFPLLVLLLVSIPYWITYRKQETAHSGKQNIGYGRIFLALVAIGYFGIWIFWLGGILLLLLNRYFPVMESITCSFLRAAMAQIIGLIIVYIGSLFFAWAIGYADKYLRPSTAGIHPGHVLVHKGPLGIVRHPYYVSYVLMLIGPGFALATFWPFVLAFLVIIGMGPTADAEEKQLEVLFGEESHQYKQDVGRFIPKLPGR
jgi:protein-S-isoprenylcysteine O-methyltransferase Ste14